MSDAVEYDVEKVIAEAFNDVFSCPYCGTHAAITADNLLSVNICSHCERPSLIPARLGEMWLLQELGCGGRGTVYMAVRDDARAQPLAVKVIPRDVEDHTRYRETLERELAIASQLPEHDSLVHVIEGGAIGDETYMVMNYIEGDNLARIIEESDGLPTEPVLRIGKSLISALRAVASTGYLYRDLKPENIMMRQDGSVVLVDFGLAIKGDIAQSGDSSEVEGSPIYVPPERLLGQGEDIRSEIYSLGHVLYHAACGTPYYNAQEVFNVLRAHTSGIRVRTQRIKLTRVREDLMMVISRMIKRNIDDRFPDYDEVEAAFDEIIAAPTQS
jgi:serine/threonine protein kinase